MGGSSLAPEVITRTAGAGLTILDTTSPGQISAALADRLTTTAVVISSKSGSTVETDSHKRVYERAFREAGGDEPEGGERRVAPPDVRIGIEDAVAVGAGRDVQW
jgi:glucose-6-phosphate isomerase